MENLNTLEIRILLKCNKKEMLSRKNVNALYVLHTLQERKKAISNLIKYGLIIAKEFPKPDAVVAPVFYEITKKGKDWVKNYLANYPKG